MYQRILVPLDGSELAECALSHVKNLVRTGCAREVVLLNVFWALTYPLVAGEPPASYITQIIRSARSASKKYLADVQSRLSADGIPVKTESLEDDRPGAAISDYAQKNGVDLIIMGTHGYTGLKKMMLGSVAIEVLHNSRVPVLLIRAESCAK